MTSHSDKTAEATTAEAKKHQIALMFSGLVIVMLMSALNQTILAPSLPTIVGELHGVEHMSWVIATFILLSTITMPVYGKLSDQFGRKPFLIFAILSFMTGSIIGALAPDMTWLIVARALQGVGGGGLMILSQSVVADVIPARERGKYMGIIGGVFAFSSVAGPLIGGWITEGPGWRWAFWLNLPLAVLAIFAVIFLLPHTALKDREKRQIDYLGSIILMAGTSALVLATIWGGNQYAWNSPQIIGLLIASVVAALIFIPVENRAAEPIMPMYLFTNRNFLLTLGASLALGVAMFGAVEYIPTYLQMSLGVSATVAGLLMIPLMGALLVVSINRAAGLRTRQIQGICGHRYRTRGARALPDLHHHPEHPHLDLLQLHGGHGRGPGHVDAVPHPHRAKRLPHHRRRNRHRGKQLLPPGRLNRGCITRGWSVYFAPEQPAQ